METNSHGGLFTACKFCSWEKELSSSPKFNLGDENQAFIDEILNDNQDGEPNKENDNENQHISDMEDDDGDESCLNDENVVRYFLQEEDYSQRYRDLLEVVGGFCQEISLRDLRDGTKENNEVPVAILHEISCGGHSRPYEGPSSQKQLYQKLSKRSRDFDENTTSNVDEYMRRHLTESNTQKRLIYVTNLDRWSILALFATATRKQRPALIDLVYKHLTFRASISAIPPSPGFHVFAMNFHIPYYTLRICTVKVEGSRRKSKGSPVRIALDLPFAGITDDTSTTPPKGVERLYQAQVSVVVTGIDNRIWSAYAFIDAIEDKDTVTHYHQEAQDLGLPPDPLACSRIMVEARRFLPPKRYFLKVFQIRIDKVKCEWQYIVRRFQEEVKKYVPSPI